MNHLTSYNFVLSSKPDITLKSKLGNLKDKVSQIDQNNIIYRLDSVKIYFGESTRNESKRIHERKNNVIKHQPNPLGFQHVASDNHRINKVFRLPKTLLEQPQSH